MTAIPMRPADTPLPARPGARLAGGLYLLIIAAGISAEMLIRAPILSAPAPLTAIAAQEGLFRLSLLGDVVMVLADIALALVFFHLLAHVSRPVARAAMVLRLMQAALIAVSLLFLAAVPGLIAAGEPGVAAQFVTLHAAGYDLGLIFFGGNSLLMAWLLCHSGAVPRWILAGIAVSGLIYITGGLLRLLSPGLIDAFAPAYALPLIAESSLCLWLLIRARV